MPLEQIPYAASAALYLGLLLICLSAWRQHVQGSWLAAAFAVEAAWASGLALNPFSPKGELLVEGLRAFAWFLVLIACLARSGTRRILGGASLLFWFAAAAAILGWLTLELLSTSGLFALRLGELRVWAGLLFSIVGLVLLEQVSRNMRSGREWQLKYLWLGIGCLFTFDLCMWSLTLLQGSIPAGLWFARGVINIFAGGLIVVALARIPRWDTGSFIAPRIIFFSTSFLATGVYVLAMAVASFVIRRYTGSFGSAIQAVFLAGALIVLVVALFSEQFRAWLRVWSAKYLLPYQYDYRAEWLRLSAALSATVGDRSLYERITRTMASLVNSASASLWLADGEGEFVLAGGDLHAELASRAPAKGEFLDFLRRKEWIEDLDEARAGQRAQAVPPAPNWLLELQAAWLVVPLICEDRLIGLLVIGHPLVKTRLGWEQLDVLRVSGRQVASYLAFEQAAKRLAEVSRFDALNRLSTFLMHDLRHLVAQQALVVENAAKHRNNPEFIDDAILTIDNSVKRMTRLMEQLRTGIAGEAQKRVDLADACAEVASRCHDREPRPKLHVHERPLEVLVDRERLVHVLEHLVRNAQDATEPSGSVEIGLRRASQKAIIEISDTGSGMDGDFVRDRLFRPFDTTKGNSGMGIGAYEAREFVRKAGGAVEVDSRPARGTQFRVVLPVAPALTPDSA